MNLGQWLKYGVGAVLPVLAVACSGTVEKGETGSSGASSSTTGGSTTSSTSTGGGEGRSCGGFVGAICAEDELCDYPDDHCGGADGTGVCIKRPEGCTKELAPTCGCDGQIYGNPCMVKAAGVDSSAAGSCKVPEGEFACGAQFCVSGKAYCQRTTSDVGGEPDLYKCNPLPESCGTKPDCTCLAPVACGTMCEGADSGELTVTCLGG